MPLGLQYHDNITLKYVVIGSSLLKNENNYWVKIHACILPDFLVPHKAIERGPEETTESVEIVVTDTQPVSQKPTSETVTLLGRHILFLLFVRFWPNVETEIQS